MLREQAHLDDELLADILKRHQLEDAWKHWAME
jgi:Arc/MetJ family transcription regulator